MKKILPLLILLAAAISVSSCVDFGGGKLDAFAAEQPIVYIDTEADFIEFTNYASVNPGTRYVLRTDIYLDRYYAEGGRNFSLILNGVSLDGRGHAVVGYRNTSVYAYFVNSVSQDGAIKDLKLVDAVLGTETSAAAAPIGTNAGTGYRDTMGVLFFGVGAECGKQLRCAVRRHEYRTDNRFVRVRPQFQIFRRRAEHRRLGSTFKSRSARSGRRYFRIEISAFVRKR